MKENLARSGDPCQGEIVWLLTRMCGLGSTTTYYVQKSAIALKSQDAAKLSHYFSTINGMSCRRDDQ